MTPRRLFSICKKSSFLQLLGAIKGDIESHLYKCYEQEDTNVAEFDWKRYELTELPNKPGQCNLHESQWKSRDADDTSTPIEDTYRLYILDRLLYSGAKLRIKKAHFM